MSMERALPCKLDVRKANLITVLAGVCNCALLNLNSNVMGICTDELSHNRGEISSAAPQIGNECPSSSSSVENFQIHLSRRQVMDAVIGRVDLHCSNHS